MICRWRFISHLVNKNEAFILIKKRKTSAVDIYIPEIVAICSIEKPLSIKKPNRAVPNAVENTIKAVVNAFIDPMYLTP